jgi:hypothetical protein
MSRTHSRKRARTLAFAGGGALAAAALFAIAWGKTSSSKANSADKPAEVATPALPQSAPAGIPSATVSTSNTTAPVVQPPAAPARTKAQEKTPATARDSRAAAAKVIPKPVQSRVVAAPPPRVDPPVSSVSPRQDPLPSPPQAVVVAKPAAQPPPQESTPAAPALPTAADIAPAVEAFARAIESKDIGAIRRVYPGLTSDQQRRFEQFFEGARTINASFKVASMSASGPSTADAHLVGVYEFVTVAGKTERQPVSLAATLTQDGRTWRLTSLR